MRVYGMISRISIYMTFTNEIYMIIVWIINIQLICYKCYVLFILDMKSDIIYDIDNILVIIDNYNTIKNLLQ